MTEGFPQPGPQPGAAGPPTLPPGRHGLPREAVSGHQRERLLWAMPSLCAERGYANFVMADIVATAAVSKTTFYEHFSDKQACLLAAHEHYAAALLGAIDAAVAPKDPWPENLRDGIRAALSFCAAHPEAAQLLSVGVLSCGRAGAERYRSMIEELAVRLRAANEAAFGAQHTNAALVGALFAAPMLAGVARLEDLKSLDELEQDFTEMIIAFTGGEGRPPVRGSR